MATISLFVETDQDIRISLIGIATIDIAEVTFTLFKSGVGMITYTLTGGQLVIDGNDLILRIPDNGIIAAGVYNIRLTITDTLGNIRGLALDTDKITFK